MNTCERERFLAALRMTGSRIVILSAAKNLSYDMIHIVTHFYQERTTQHGNGLCMEGRAGQQSQIEGL